MCGACAPQGMQTSGDTASTSFPLRAWPTQGTHIFAYPSIHPPMDSFIHSFSMPNVGRVQGTQEEHPPQVPSLVREARADTMIAH